MTGMQLFVLGCMGLVIIGLMGFGGWLILGNNALPADLAPAGPTQAPVQASAPLPSETPPPTRTPILPTFTLAPTTYESMIPEGWNQFTYKNVEIWVPAEFVKDSSGDKLIDLVTSKTAGKGFKTTIYLDKDEGVTTDLDSYVRDGLGHFTAEVTFLEKKDFQIGNYEVRRIKSQVIILGVSVGVMDYLIKDGSTVWDLACMSYYDELHDWQPVFDQVAQTFRIK
ncbi:MAG TPA: hypothetical protein VMC09_02100 [Anaerolineales bacterium]|nr:hypothetical protein [Anaerolineales bacterium]